jgi:hypothetical protein
MTAPACGKDLEVPTPQKLDGFDMTRKSIPVANPNSHREMLGQSPELQRPYLRTIELQAVEVAFSGIAWFVAVMWLKFVGGPQLGLTVVIVAGMLVMFLTLLLLAISKAIDEFETRQRLALASHSSLRTTETAIPRLLLV